MQVVLAPPDSPPSPGLWLLTVSLTEILQHLTPEVLQELLQSNRKGSKWQSHMHQSVLLYVFLCSWSSIQLYPGRSMQRSAPFSSLRQVLSMQQNQPNIQNCTIPFGARSASIIHHLLLPTLYISVPSFFLNRKRIKPLENSKWFTCIINTSQCDSIQYVTLCCFTSITVS